MSDADTQQPRKGRKPRGDALSSTQRNAALRERVRAAGGLVATVRLDPAAAADLAELRRDGATIDAAVSAALREAAARRRG